MNNSIGGARVALVNRLAKQFHIELLKNMLSENDMSISNSLLKNICQNLCFDKLLKDLASEIICHLQ
jgi:hypothetical protein